MPLSAVLTYRISVINNIAIKNVVAVVGNSSSGIIEAPTLKTPSVNIGDRQKGRLRAKSVIDCGTTKGEMVNALKKSLSSDFAKLAKKVSNPYEKESTSFQIKEIIKNFKLDGILKKSFFKINIHDFIT